MVKVVYTRKYIMDSSKVRQFCIDWNLYTSGDNEAYSEMFKMCSKYSGDIDDLELIAKDIVEHSDSEELEDYGCENDYEVISMIMGELERRCVWVSVVAKEVE